LCVCVYVCVCVCAFVMQEEFVKRRELSSIKGFVNDDDDDDDVKDEDDVASVCVFVRVCAWVSVGVCIVWCDEQSVFSYQDVISY